jgi:hypothetical protein
MPPTNSSPRDDHLHDALKTFWDAVSTEKIPAVDNWQVGYKPAMHRYTRAPYWDHSDSPCSIENAVRE